MINSTSDFDLSLIQSVDLDDNLERIEKDFDQINRILNELSTDEYTTVIGDYGLGYREIVNAFSHGEDLYLIRKASPEESVEKENLLFYAVKCKPEELFVKRFHPSYAKKVKPYSTSDLAFALLKLESSLVFDYPLEGFETLVSSMETFGMSDLDAVSNTLADMPEGWGGYDTLDVTGLARRIVDVTTASNLIVDRDFKTYLSKQILITSPGSYWEKNEAEKKKLINGAYLFS
jgi:hypothetical protein